MSLPLPNHSTVPDHRKKHHSVVRRLRETEQEPDGCSCSGSCHLHSTCSRWWDQHCHQILWNRPQYDGGRWHAWSHWESRERCWAWHSRQLLHALPDSESLATKVYREGDGLLWVPKFPRTQWKGNPGKLPDRYIPVAYDPTRKVWDSHFYGCQ